MHSYEAHKLNGYRDWYIISAWRMNYESWSRLDNQIWCLFLVETSLLIALATASIEISNPIKMKRKRAFFQFLRRKVCFINFLKWSIAKICQVPATMQDAYADFAFFAFYNTQLSNLVNKHEPFAGFSKRKLNQLCRPWLESVIQKINNPDD